MEASHVHERKPIDGMVMPATESMDAIRAFFGLATQTVCILIKRLFISSADSKTRSNDPRQHSHKRLSQSITRKRPSRPSRAAGFTQAI